MQRDQILRDDFPISRKGWDPEAVTAHLKAIADSPPPAQDAALATIAAQRVGSVIEAAELQAAALEGEARSSAETTVANANSEADSTLKSARAEAKKLTTDARAEADKAVKGAKADAAKLREDAEQEVHETVTAARREARETLAKARAEAKDTVESANAEAVKARDEAKAEAKKTVADARAEAKRIVSEARDAAGERVDLAAAAVEGLADEATALRERIGALGAQVAGGLSSLESEVTPPVTVPEPGPAQVPEPTPVPGPEPTPDPVPEPTPDPVPEPTPDPEPEAPADVADAGADAGEAAEDEEDEDGEGEPAPNGADRLEARLAELQAEAGHPAAGEALPADASPDSAVSTDDLIEQLRSASAPLSSNGGNGTTANFDLAAARLVGMNMALEGAARTEIEERVKSEFGDFDELDELLEDVLTRSGRA